jgi:hypothetical protein
MRWHCKAMIVAVMALVAVGLSTAQQPQFGGFGGFGKGPTNPATLLQNESVKKELRLTDEQLAKIPDAVMKALGEVLDAEQLKRLKQIDLQLKGPRAFADANVQTSLKMNAEQKDNIKSILADADKELAEIRKEMQKEIQAGNFQALQAMNEKMTTINKDLQSRVSSVLTPDQKRNWQEMIGDEFKIEQPKFGFGKKDKK